MKKFDIGDCPTEEKDLVILLGSFLIYKYADFLYELIDYIRQYSVEDFKLVLNKIFESITEQERQWFQSFLEIVSDIDFISNFLSNIDFFVEQVYKNIFSPNFIDSNLTQQFIEFWVV